MRPPVGESVASLQAKLAASQAALSAAQSDRDSAVSSKNSAIAAAAVGWVLFGLLLIGGGIAMFVRARYNPRRSSRAASTGKPSTELGNKKAADNV